MRLKAPLRWKLDGYVLKSRKGCIPAKYVRQLRLLVVSIAVLLVVTTHSLKPILLYSQSNTVFQISCRKLPYLHTRTTDDVAHFTDWIKNVWVRVGTMRMSLAIEKSVAITFEFKTGSLFNLSQFDKNSQCDRIIRGPVFAFREWWVDAASHFLFDHFPVIAWIRGHMMMENPWMRGSVLLLDEIDTNKQFMEFFDEKFASRIVWVEEGHTVCVNGEFIFPVYREDTVSEKDPRLEKLMPPVWTRGSIEGRPSFGAIRLPAFVDLTREWISERSELLVTQPLKPVVLYYVRGPWTNGRWMNESQDDFLVDDLRKNLRRCGRMEEVIIFTGRDSLGEKQLSLKDQFLLFSSATMFVGPHGGGVANIIFMNSIRASTSDKCDSRPQVLEFTPGRRSGHVHWAFASYYDHYYGPTWIEYHMLQFRANSSKSYTSIDVDEWNMAMRAVFSGERCCIHEKQGCSFHNHM